MQQQTLLLTGFEPFDKWDVNPSWKVARALDGTVVSGGVLGVHEVSSVVVVSRRLPVDWERAWPALHAAIEETHPRWVVLLGLGGRPAISVESVALNVCAGRPDNAGKFPSDDIIAPEGAASLEVTLPVESVVEAVKVLGLPTEKSVDAGGYLCNYTLYKALEWAKPLADAPLIGFIHLPNLPGANHDMPSMALDDMIRAIRTALSITVNASRTPA